MNPLGRLGAVCESHKRAEETQRSLPYSALISRREKETLRRQVSTTTPFPSCTLAESTVLLLHLQLCSDALQVEGPSPGITAGGKLRWEDEESEGRLVRPCLKAGEGFCVHR